MHEFRRDIVPPLVENPTTAVIIAVVLSLVATLYGTGFQGDWPWAQTTPAAQQEAWAIMACRFVASLIPSAAAVVGMIMWAYVYYPVCLMHVFTCASVATTVSTLFALNPTMASRLTSDTLVVVRHAFAPQQSGIAYSRVHAF
jgi:hypothetical protein